MAKQHFLFQNKLNQAESVTESGAVSITENPTVESMVKKLETPRTKNTFDIKVIPRQKIRVNQKNNYPMVEIESLMESILYFGLLQPINVIYIMDEDMYCIEAGHRRTEAIDRLIQKYKNQEATESEDYTNYQRNVKQFETGYPCNVVDILKDDIPYDYAADIPLEEIPESIIDSEIRLIITNEENRDRSPSVRAANVARLSRLYERKNLNKAKRSDKININKKIAEELNITERQVINYKNLNKLIPELKEEFDRNNISLKAGSNYARLSEEEQYSILKVIQSGIQVSANEIQTLLKDKNELLKKMEAKENQIEKLKAAVSGESPSGHLERIKSLENELNLLKDKSGIIPTQNTELLKADLQTRNALDQVQTAISFLLKSLSQLEELRSKQADMQELNIISQDEIRQKKQIFTDMLNIV